MVATVDGLKIYRVITGDGVIQHFPSEAEAHFAAKDAKDSGISAMIHEIPFPGTPGAFADFCDCMIGVFRKYGRE